ncbi:MAG: hypothetical protein ACOC46_02820, partial [Pirellulales bacterium]
GMMYLWQSGRLKRKQPPRPGLRLPSLEWLAGANRRALIVAVLALAVGVVAGAVLAILRGVGEASRLPWWDPVVLSTVVMLVWLLTAVALTARTRVARQGRAVAYLTVVSFVFLAVALAAMLVLDTRHGGVRAVRAPRPPSSGFPVERQQRSQTRGPGPAGVEGR